MPTIHTVFNISFAIVDIKSAQIYNKFEAKGIYCAIPFVTVQVHVESRKQQEQHGVNTSPQEEARAGSATHTQAQRRLHTFARTRLSYGEILTAN